MANTEPLNEAPTYIQTPNQLSRWTQAIQAAQQATGTLNTITIDLAQALYHSPLPTNTPLTEAFNPNENRIPEHQPHAGEWLPKLQHITLHKTPEAPENAEARFHTPKPGPVAQRILYGARDTKHMYSTAPTFKTSLTSNEDAYVPARLQAHNNYIQHRLEGHATQHTPQALVIAGGTAAGKTRLINDHPELTPTDYVKVDPDDAKYAMPEFNAMLNERDPYAAFAVHRESGDIAHKLQNHGMAEHKNLLIDTTGNRGPHDFKNQIQSLLDHGYKTRIVYVNESTSNAVAGNLARADVTGRVVPPREVRRIHKNVSVNFPDIRKMVGETTPTGGHLQSVSILDHDHPDMPGGLIYHHEDGSPEQVLKPTQFARFQAKADEKIPDPITESIMTHHPGVHPQYVIEIPQDISSWGDSQHLNEDFNTALGPQEGDTNE